MRRGGRAAASALLLALYDLACYPVARPDTYSSFAELSAHEREGADYQITVEDRSAPVTVFAIHGGAIDLGTDVIARALAGGDWSLYVFKGIKPKGNWALHITSARFDEPRALALAEKANRCLSVHGHQSSVPRICVGGLDQRQMLFADRALLDRTVAAIRAAVDPAPPR